VVTLYFPRTFNEHKWNRIDVEDRDREDGPVVESVDGTKKWIIGYKPE
jgi:hypothetical protein